MGRYRLSEAQRTGLAEADRELAARKLRPPEEPKTSRRRNLATPEFTAWWAHVSQCGLCQRIGKHVSCEKGETLFAAIVPQRAGAD